MRIGQPKADILEAYEQICRDCSATQPVGSEYYQWFVNLSDSHVLAILELMVLDRADEINSWVFAERRTRTSQDILDYLEALLEAFGHGLLQINSNGSLGCTAPDGPRPTDAEAREIDHKTRAVRPLYRQAVMNVLKKEKEMG